MKKGYVFAVVLVIGLLVFPRTSEAAFLKNFFNSIFGSRVQEVIPPATRLEGNALDATQQEDESVTEEKTEAVVDDVKVVSDTCDEKLTVSQYVSYGMYNSDVKTVQTRLECLGYKISVDGQYGNQTVQAVAAFQQGHGIAGNGTIVGAKTLSALRILLIERSLTTRELTVRKSMTSPAAATYAPGTLNVHFVDYDLIANSAGTIDVTSIHTMIRQMNPSIQSGSLAISNLRLLIDGVQVGPTIPTPQVYPPLSPFFNTYGGLTVTFAPDQVRKASLYFDIAPNAQNGTTIDSEATTTTFIPYVEPAATTNVRYEQPLNASVVTIGTPTGTTCDVHLDMVQSRGTSSTITVPYGTNSLTLNWSSSNCNSVMFDGVPVASISSQWLGTLTTTATHVLLGTNVPGCTSPLGFSTTSGQSCESDRDEITIIVDPLPPPPGPCTIDSLITPATTSLASNLTIPVTWATTDCTSVTIITESGHGRWPHIANGSGSYTFSGMQPSTTDSTVDVTIIAASATKISTRVNTVAVIDVPNPSSSQCNFSTATATPNPVPATSASTTLSWAAPSECIVYLTAWTPSTSGGSPIGTYIRNPSASPWIGYWAPTGTVSHPVTTPTAFSFHAQAGSLSVTGNTMVMSNKMVDVDKQ